MTCELKWNIIERGQLNCNRNAETELKDKNAEIEYQCTTMIDYLAAVMDAQNDSDFVALYDVIVSNLASRINMHLDGIPKEDFLSSEQAVIEIRDTHSQHILRRAIPLSFMENNNGLILKGEDATGKESSIVFLADGVPQKIADVLGYGSDARHKH